MKKRLFLILGTLIVLLLFLLTYIYVAGHYGSPGQASKLGLFLNPGTGWGPSLTALPGASPVWLRTSLWWYFTVIRDGDSDDYILDTNSIAWQRLITTLEAVKAACPDRNYCKVVLTMFGTPKKSANGQNSYRADPAVYGDSACAPVNANYRHEIRPYIAAVVSALHTADTQGLLYEPMVYEFWNEPDARVFGCWVGLNHTSADDVKADGEAYGLALNEFYLGVRDSSQAAVVASGGLTWSGACLADVDQPKLNTPEWFLQGFMGAPGCPGNCMNLVMFHHYDGNAAFQGTQIWHVNETPEATHVEGGHVDVDECFHVLRAQLAAFKTPPATDLPIGLNEAGLKCNDEWFGDGGWITLTPPPWYKDPSGDFCINGVETIPTRYVTATGSPGSGPTLHPAFTQIAPTWIATQFVKDQFNWVQQMDVWAMSHGLHDVIVFGLQEVDYYEVNVCSGNCGVDGTISLTDSRKCSYCALRYRTTGDVTYPCYWDASQSPPALACTNDLVTPTALANPTGYFNPQYANTAYWSNPENIYTENQTYTTSDIQYSNVYYTHGVQSKQYPFDIPVGSTIDGIEVQIVRKASQNCLTCTPFHGIKDSVVRLLKYTGELGYNYAKSDWWTTSDSTVTYGGSTNLWGATWTPEEINAASFGVVIRLVVTDGDHDGSAYGLVDNIRVRVYWH